MVISGLMFLGVLASFYLNKPLIRYLFYRAKLLFKSILDEREIFNLSNERHLVSVEKALNSRCTSDDDNEQKIFHWGIFDRTRKLSDYQLSELVDKARIPRFTKHSLEIRRERNILTFITDYDLPDEQRQWLMVESGMLQQAVCLLCAASNIGMVFENLGLDGSRLNSYKLAVISMKLDAMKPSYDGEYWSTNPPRGEQPWMKGNMKDPQRDGNIPLMSAINDLKISNASEKIASEEDLSQLLWAARGRTPHFYNSRAWGLTIPTWGGEQNISGIYLVSRDSLSKYINWHQDRPTHKLSELHKIDKKLFQKSLGDFSENYGFIIFEKNENFGRALWEIGYQLLNVLLQAKALGIFYQAFLLDETQKSNVRMTGVNDPVAILAV